MTADKQHAHELIERLAPSQVPAVIGMLERLLDPVSRAVANAPIDDNHSHLRTNWPSPKRASGRSITKPLRMKISWLNSVSPRKRSTTIGNRSEPNRVDRLPPVEIPLLAFPAPTRHHYPRQNRRPKPQLTPSGAANESFR